MGHGDALAVSRRQEQCAGDMMARGQRPEVAAQDAAWTQAAARGLVGVVAAWASKKGGREKEEGRWGVGFGWDPRVVFVLHESQTLKGAKAQIL